jgi:hypothetical protein
MYVNLLTAACKCLKKIMFKKREDTDLLLGKAILKAHDVLHFQLGLQL